MALDELIVALSIFRKYGNPEWPIQCEHDELWICGIDPNEVSQEDIMRLDGLGFFVDSGGFTSLRYGSA